MKGKLEEYNYIHQGFLKVSLFDFKCIWNPLCFYYQVRAFYVIISHRGKTVLYHADVILQITEVPNPEIISTRCKLF